MVSAPTLESIFELSTPLIAMGAALHWLRPYEKAPIRANWSTARVLTTETFADEYRKNANVGIRLGEPSKTDIGFLHLIDLDIRDESKANVAWDVVKSLIPNHAELPSVISGSGGSSRHIYFFSDKPFKSRKLAKSSGFAMVADAKKGRDVKKYDWEIELFGTGKQAVLPPSIHPDTKKPYIWERQFDFDMIDLGIAPTIDSSTVESWGVVSNEFVEPDDDDLATLVRLEPMDLSGAEVDAALADLPTDWIDDRDMWLQVGAALHHQFRGDDVGFKKWCEWSNQSEKYDPSDQKRVWNSLKGSKRPIRMATILHAAAQNRLATAHDFDHDLPVSTGDLDDLLGESKVDVDDILGPVEIQTPSSIDWRSLLQVNEDGSFKASLPNVELIFGNDPRSHQIVAHNEFSQELVLVKSPGTMKLKRPGPKPIRQLTGPVWDVHDALNGDLWTDSHDHAVRLVFEAPIRQGGYGIKISDRDLHGAIDIVAHQQTFHPVRHYLNGLTWDGVKRLDNLFVDYLGCEDTVYHREAARLTMLGAVARVFEPGHKFDFVPILEGLQGKGKSTFVKVLGCHWSTELSGDFHDAKTMIEQMQGAWIMEIPELQGFSRAEINVLKAFLSKEKDKARLSYDRRARIFPRQCIFIGSTNDSQYLRDPTGGRRFWPIYCNLEGEINTSKLRREIDHYWAEAVSVYKQMRQAQKQDHLPLYMVDRDAAKEATELQESRRIETIEDQLAGQIKEWVDTPIGADFDDLENDEPHYIQSICTLTIWCEMFNENRGRITQQQSQMIGRALKIVPGWVGVGRKYTKDYGRQRCFVREGNYSLEE